MKHVVVRFREPATPEQWLEIGAKARYQPVLTAYLPNLTDHEVVMLEHLRLTKGYIIGIRLQPENPATRT